MASSGVGKRSQSLLALLRGRRPRSRPACRPTPERTPGMAKEKLDGCADRMIWAIRRIIRTVAVHSRRLSIEYNITGPQLSALNVLHRRGRLTGTEIATALLLSPSTIVGVLDRLEEKGLVERSRDKRDRRRVFVTLTGSGERLVREVPHPLENSLMKALCEITEARKEAMAQVLEEVVELIGAKNVSREPLDEIDIQSHNGTKRQAPGSSKSKKDKRNANE
ncbi:MAG: MarR family transcriptional regulator [Candidatus Eisenbacteria bacterium]|nr:MarR family transcriptional regulator [Candidatus Eisenbacteria bacterium]